MRVTFISRVDREPLGVRGPHGEPTTQTRCSTRRKEATNSTFFWVPPELLTWEGLDGGLSVGDRQEKQLQSVWHSASRPSR